MTSPHLFPKTALAGARRALKALPLLPYCDDVVIIERQTLREGLRRSEQLGVAKRPTRGGGGDHRPVPGGRVSGSELRRAEQKQSIYGGCAREQCNCIRRQKGHSTYTHT